MFNLIKNKVIWGSVFWLEVGVGAAESSWGENVSTTWVKSAAILLYMLLFPFYSSSYPFQPSYGRFALPVRRFSIFTNGF